MSAQTLIVLGSSLTALAVARTASRSGLSCILVDDIRGPAASTRAAEFRALRSVDESGIYEAVADRVGGQDVTVVADSDRWLRFVRDHRHVLENSGWQVLHPDSRAIETCLDKTTFLTWCAAQHLPAPRLYQVEDVRQLGQDHYPLLLRPEWTQHSSATGLPKAIEIKRPGDLDRWLREFDHAGVRPTICESLLREGLQQYSVGASRDRAGRVLTFLAEKVRPHAEQCAGGTFVRPAVNDDVEHLAAAALNAIDYFGVAEVEVLFDPAQRRGFLIEINARPWLQYGLPFVSGCDLLAHAVGREPSSAKVDKRHAWLYFHSDLYACFSRSTGLLATGKIGVGEYLRTIGAADIYALWDARDPLPFIHSSLRAMTARLKRLFRIS